MGARDIAKAIIITGTLASPVAAEEAGLASVEFPTAVGQSDTCESGLELDGSIPTDQQDLYNIYTTLADPSSGVGAQALSLLDGEELAALGEEMQAINDENVFHVTSYHSGYIDSSYSTSYANGQYTSTEGDYTSIHRDLGAPLNDYIEGVAQAVVDAGDDIDARAAAAEGFSVGAIEVGDATIAHINGIIAEATASFDAENANCLVVGTPAAGTAPVAE